MNDFYAYMKQQLAMLRISLKLLSAREQTSGKEIFYIHSVLFRNYWIAGSKNIFYIKDIVTWPLVGKIYLS